MKKTKLVQVSYIIETETDELNLQDISKDMFINEIGILKWEETSIIELDDKHINCGKCSSCGCWVTDMDKSDSINGLCRGARVDDKLYCDECLPDGHKWAF